ncbi:MAG: asparagine synthase (glutamine-hydrolyzing) [Candidatus Paceibacterota bacterium]|jgi:asparagine synthase (glutamine-hydrolysing)
MCGIAGIVTKKAEEHRGHIKRMTDSLAHRGPDGEGIYFFKNCVLGHRRLSIVDLSTGAQPMFSANRDLGITFNGEIYGYKEIKTKEFSHYSFQTTSDTELILAMYEKYQEKAPEYLPGMFAFALWDEKKQKLFCARDRFGEKPFYYAIGKNGEFIFASEIKAILASGLVKPTLDKQSLSFYLKHAYVHPHHSIYKNIHVLPPAHSLTYEQGKITVTRYWNIPPLRESISLNEAAGEVKRLFDQAVKKQLVADVEVGAFLSGGLDSSTIVAVASKYKKGIKTVSFAFRNSTDETPFAREIAEKYGANHKELYDDQGETLGDLFLKIQNVYDEPSADSSNIPTYLISKLSRKECKVTLTGEGGDELLGGYVAYRPFLFAEKSIKNATLNTFVLRLIANALIRRGFGTNLKHQFAGAHYAYNFDSMAEAHQMKCKAFSAKETARLGLESFPETSLYSPSWKMTGTMDDIFRLDLENFMPGDILVKSDRASMAHGLELRAPFLDVDFASFCISLPHQLKLTKDQDKLALRAAFEDMWTTSIRARGKQGFGAPITKWLTEDQSLIDLKKQYLENKNGKIYKILSFDEVQPMLAHNDYRTWTFLELALWAETHEFEYE